jgi:hypothetical protein
LILGLEGSPHGVHTLWRLNLRLRLKDAIHWLQWAHCRA